MTNIILIIYPALLAVSKDRGQRTRALRIILWSHRSIIRFMELIGYGEDAITFWILTNRLDKILERFDDNSKESECCVYYRPSFGRGGKSRSLLGEFDAVLITPKCTYLIESKWEGSKELSTHELSKGQKKRHDMFTLIARAWDKNCLLYTSPSPRDRG